MSADAGLRASALRTPHKTALICGDDSITYRDLDAAVDRLARIFIAEGLQPGDRVAIHWPNATPAVELILAAMRAGLIAVPMNMRLKPAEVDHILQHSAAVRYFTPSNFPKGEAPPVSFPDRGPEDPCVILYTSGTTARPKGVTHCARSLDGAARLMSILGASQDTVMLLMVSIMHASGLICALHSTLKFGGTAVMIPVFDPGLALDAIERHRCDWGAALPALAHFVVEEQILRPRDVSSLVSFFAGGDSIPGPLQDRFQQHFGIPLYELYGMSESVPTCSNRAGAARRGSLGRLLPGVEARIVGGEMLVRSEANFLGYWNDPAETAATVEDGWLLTGDLVREDADGYYWFEGRKKQIIVRGGSNIAPQEVEEILYRHPAVREAGVVGIPDPIYGQSVVAFVALRHPATEHDLRAHCRTLLSDQKVPEHIHFLETLPKGPTGKVQRRELKDSLVSG